MDENEAIYEYTELTDSEKAAPEGSGRLKTTLRFIRFLMLFAAVIAALVVLLVNRDKLNSDNFKRLLAKIDIGMSSDRSLEGSVIDFDYNSSGSVAAFKDGVARVTSDTLVIMDNAGSQFQSVVTGFNEPALLTTDKYVMTYDRGGKRLIITNSFAVLFDHSFEDNIVTAAMNDSGCFAVVTESEAYKNKLIVFDSSFNEIYRINSMSRYILAVGLSEDGKHAAVSSYYVENDNMTPQINYYKFNSETAQWTSEYEQSVAVDIACRSDGTVAALFEWGVSVVDSKGREKCRYEFGSRIPQAYRLGDDKYNAVASGDSKNGSSTVTVFDSGGRTLSETDVGATVLSLDLHGDRMAVLTAEKVLIYTVSGKLICEKENESDGSQIIFSGKNAVLVVSGSDIVYNLID